MTPYRPGLGAHEVITRQDAEAFVREAIGPEYVGDFDVPAIADRLYDLAGSWDVGSVETYDFWATVKAHDLTAQGTPAPQGQDLPLLDSADAAAAEMRWVAGEARALMSDGDPERRARFLTRKRRLLDFIEQRQTGGRP